MTLQKLKRSFTSIKFIDKNKFLIGSDCLKAVFFQTMLMTYSACFKIHKVEFYIIFFLLLTCNCNLMKSRKIVRITG